MYTEKRSTPAVYAAAKLDSDTKKGSGMLCFDSLSRDELVALLIDAHTDRAYGCLTRVGFERRYTDTATERHAIIFLDLDGMHGANEIYGHSGADDRISRSLQSVRAGDNLIGRWYSGDEIVLLVPYEAAHHIAHRLQSAFVANGLSATFGIVPALTNIESAVKVAINLVECSKNAGIRGVIIE